MKTKILILITLTTIFAGLTAAQGQSTNLEMEVMHTEPVPLQAGEYADIWIRVTNTGSAEARNPRFEVKDNFPFTPTDKSEFEVASGGLGTGEHRDIRVQVKVSENAAFGNNTLKIEKTSGNRDASVEERIPLEVRTDDRSLFVSELEFEDRVEPGSSTEMSLTLENLAESNFRNIDVSLDTSELPISTRETSRQRVSSVGPSSSEEVNFMIDVEDDADNELHDLPITIDYQDQAGNELTMTETTGVNVGGFPNIDVAIEESDIRTSGRGEVTFSVWNRGEGQARFVELKLEESDQYEILSESSIPLSSMISDDFQTAEFDLYVKDDESPLELPVTVDYRDGDGDQSSEFDIQRSLYSSNDLRRYGLDQSGTPWAIIIVALGLIVGGAVYWRKKKKNSE